MFIDLGGHKSLQSMKQLSVHRLVYNFVQDLIEFNSLANELSLTPIETLSFQNSFSDSLDYNPWNLISLNLDNSSLKNLRMTENRLGESLSPYQLFRPPPSLQELNLSSNKLEKFALNLDNIRNLSLQNNFLGRFLTTHSYKIPISYNRLD
ncbi:Hypothetical predicted protein [Mytilus galloprovincialis]|uniref:Uncharacterized protein n=1 Tax=Mytilus galloprovincialis TaxID=29158 RepID=A0A8B6DV11_MYTGA|nr:Hypothetical predicted protein [Mytilus galloprovincialis]